ncbi:exo-alpha-sialidase [Streptomyces sp. NA04227]|uniref:sialidase family protein n=1 Tax=Streptomyces sp. NA04227 TaxID=2742136 RepID=UPI001591FD43|nr:sialidase family protein [Streptomyces sp. NA04227]QKW06137.1 exo-alpha-sialidase [Streptomyces sp. NA04227]
MTSETSVPFRAGTEGYASFRIPAVVVTGENTVLAFCEGRVGSAEDHGDIDIVLKRSHDGGRTWAPLERVAENGDDLAGNPAPVVLSSGRILLVHVRNAAAASEAAIRRGEVAQADARRVWVQYSDDDGVTWSEAREITEQTKDPDWRWYATTPGHALQLTGGRVLVPANHSLPPTGSDLGTEGAYNGGHSLLSDDEGQTWRIGYVHNNADALAALAAPVGSDVPPGPDGHPERINANETTAAELPDGRLYFNTRNDSAAPGTRADAYSSDGAELTAPYRPQPGIEGPVVQGSLLQLRDPDLLLYSGPAHPERRARMTVRASSDHGTHWRVAHVVDESPAAYSDLVRLDAGTVGLLFETGATSSYETLSFRRIPVTALLRTVG